MMQRCNIGYGQILTDIHLGENHVRTKCSPSEKTRTDRALPAPLRTRACTRWCVERHFAHIAINCGHGARGRYQTRLSRLALSTEAGRKRLSLGSAVPRIAWPTALALTREHAEALMRWHPVERPPNSCACLTGHRTLRHPVRMTHLTHETKNTLCCKPCNSKPTTHPSHD